MIILVKMTWKEFVYKHIWSIAIEKNPELFLIKIFTGKKNSYSRNLGLTTDMFKKK